MKTGTTTPGTRAETRNRRAAPRRGKGEDPAAALSAYLDGELPAPSAERLRRRLAGDPRLRRESDRLREVSALLRVLPTPDPGFVARWKSRRESLSIIPRWTWRQFGLRLAAAAAVALAAAGLSLWQQPLPEAAGPDSAESLLALEDRILGAAGEASALVGEWDDPAAPEQGPASWATDPEPVLRIALGASFPLEPAR